MIEIKFIKSSDLAKAAKECLSARLYVPKSGYLMNNQLNLIVKHKTSERHKLVVAYSDGKPVGVAMAIADYYSDYQRVYIQTFVKKSFRRRGIGKSMVMEMKKQVDKPLWAFQGATGSEYFWEDVSVKCV